MDKEKNFALGYEGFHITFQNGYKVSVMFGYGHHCENQLSLHDLVTHPKATQPMQSDNCEILIWDNHGEIVTGKCFQGTDMTEDYASPENVLTALQWARNQQCQEHQVVGGGGGVILYQYCPFCSKKKAMYDPVSNTSEFYCTSCKRRFSQINATHRLIRKKYRGQNAE